MYINVHTLIINHLFKEFKMFKVFVFDKWEIIFSKDSKHDFLSDSKGS